jgi:hypothetical protein
VFVFEYQFPKAESHTILNDWVRQKFNRVWRHEHQQPRGNLFEITSEVRAHRSLYQWAQAHAHAAIVHSLEEFAGVIFSQARYLMFEAQQKMHSTDLRQSVMRELREVWGIQDKIEFSYPFEGIVFRKRFL